MPGKFDGQRVLVLGGSSGIGLASAQALAAAGARVTIASRSQDKLDEAVRGSGGQFAAVRLDGSVEADVRDFFDAHEPFHHLVLCANAGGTIGPLRDIDMPAMREYFDNKLWVYLHALKYGGRKLAAGGSVTLVNGAASQLAVSGMSALAVVNGGLDAILRPLALELAPARINAVSPGVIDSPYWAKMPADRRAQMYEVAARGVPVQRVGTTVDVADAVVFLAGNGFITGTVLLVDGGRHLTPNIG